MTTSTIGRVFRTAPLWFGLIASVGSALANSCNADRETLRQFLANYHSPLVNLIDDLFQHSLTYNVDPRLLVAIAWQETHAGNGDFTLTDQNNIWDDFYQGVHNSPFESPDQALADAARTLRDKFLSAGYRTIRDIGYTYTATQQEAWVANVSYLYQLWGGDLNDLSYSCPSQPVIFFDDADSRRDPSGANFPWKQGTWGIAPGVGTPTFFSLQFAWGTGPYYGPQNIAMFSRTFDLRNLSTATLTFWHRYEIDSNNDDLWVWISTDGGNSFYRLYPNFSGNQGRWVKAAYGLDAYIGKPSVMLAFQLYSGANTGRHQGWSIDNIAVIGGGAQATNGAADLDTLARADMIKRASQDSRFGGALFNTFDKDLNWESGFELRWMAFSVTGGRTAFIFDARSTSTGDRFTTYFDPDSGQQVPWLLAQ